MIKMSTINFSIYKKAILSMKIAFEQSNIRIQVKTPRFSRDFHSPTLCSVNQLFE